VTIGYYIYYRVAPGKSAHAKQIVDSIQEKVHENTGVRGRLLHRRDDPATWMEVYEGVADDRAFGAALADAVDKSGFSGVLADGSARITEVFGPV